MEYSIEKLEQINIHSLRNIAREIGVKSPSCLKKKELIDEIILIKSGKKPPSLTIKGRPPKMIINEPLNKTPIDKRLKKEIIDCILKNIEEKLNQIL